ncbi:hypothetical protein M885DRAFT_501345, partial [Pelagophyceae sp. CCMP2097]
AELRLQARVNDLEADLELTRKAAGDAQRTANAQFAQLERDLDAARIAQRPAQSGDAWPAASPAASAASPAGPASVDGDDSAVEVSALRAQLARYAESERLVDEQLARVEEESAEIKRLRRDVEARGKTPITAVALRKRNGELETQVQDLENRPRRKAGGGLSSIAELLKGNRRRSPDAAQNGAEKRCAALEDELEEQRAHSELRLRALREEFERLRVVHEKRLGELRQQGLRQSRDAGARQSIDAAAPDDVRRSRPGGVAGAEQRRIAELETQVRALEAAQCSALEGARRGPDAAAGGDGARLESLRVELDREREMRLRGEASAEPARRLLEVEVRSARAAAADSRAEADDAARRSKAAAADADALRLELRQRPAAGNADRANRAAEAAEEKLRYAVAHLDAMRSAAKLAAHDAAAARRQLALAAPTTPTDVAVAALAAHDGGVVHTTCGSSLSPL